MRSFDYSPLYRSTVGFDRLFDMLDSSVRSDWPPYNIDKKSENDYRITMAIAGFSPDEVELTQHGPELIVTGQKNPIRRIDRFFIRGWRSATSSRCSSLLTTSRSPMPRWRMVYLRSIWCARFPRS